MKTIFITGASSGIGKETAKYFQSKGWNVIASMRRPEEEKELTNLTNVEVLHCDVTDKESIQAAINQGIQRFGRIDVLVNNAGYYLVGPLEAATSEQIIRQLNTNLLGLIETTKAVIPHFRENRSGTIINLSSIAGRLSIPLQSLYHTTKYGIEGFSESLQYELEKFNIRVKLVEPGTVRTNFCGRSMTIAQDDRCPVYEEYSRNVIGNLVKNGNSGSDPVVIAKTIYKAATDNRKKMRYPTGKMKSMMMINKILPLRVYQALVKLILE